MNHDTKEKEREYGVSAFINIIKALNEYCRRNKLQFNEIKYNETVQDIVNDNLKNRPGENKSCCGIGTSLELD